MLIDKEHSLRLAAIAGQHNVQPIAVWMIMSILSLSCVATVPGLSKSKVDGVQAPTGALDHIGVAL